MNKNSTEAFLKRLDNSRHSVFVVAKYLHHAGYGVSIPPFDYRPPNSNWEDHTDDGDMYIWREQEDRQRIDVKHVNLDFTCEQDFPYDRMLVSDIRAIKRADPFPLAYIIVNKNCTHIGIVWAKTKEHWKPYTLHASNTDMMVTAMGCPTRLVDFRSLTRNE